MEILDPELYSALRHLSQTKEEEFEGLEQYFTLPGNESFELMKNGKNIQVLKENVNKFIKVRLTRYRLSLANGSVCSWSPGGNLQKEYGEKWRL